MKNQSKISSKKRCKKQSRLGRVLGGLRAVKGAATYSDPTQRDPTRPSAPKILSRGAARAAALRAKIDQLKTTRRQSYVF